MLLLFNATESGRPGEELPPHGCRGAGHVAFSARLDELAGWMTTLRQHSVEIELDYQWPHGGRSLYFRDPAGNSLEITTPTIWRLPEVPAST
jgi:catechol 2,3-dioxygenase-like lactoylglutathione lyase family enzyme